MDKRKVHVGAEADGESRTLLKTLATGARRSQFWSHSPQFESVRLLGPDQAAGPPGQTPMSDRLQATLILLTQLLTTDLDEHGQRWNCQVAA